MSENIEADNTPDVIEAPEVPEVTEPAPTVQPAKTVAIPAFGGKAGAKAAAKPVNVVKPAAKKMISCDHKMKLKTSVGKFNLSPEGALFDADVADAILKSVEDTVYQHAVHVDKVLEKEPGVDMSNSVDNLASQQIKAARAINLKA